MSKLTNNISIKFASHKDENELQSFFSKCLSVNNKAIYNEEFLCPYGVRFAIKRRDVIIAVVDTEIIGALRFYIRKRENKISLYQFAVASNYRGLGILRKMLQKLSGKEIIVKCPINLFFNDYYVKTGWSLINHNDIFNIYSIFI